MTKVDAVKDALPAGFKPANGIERGAYKHYDSKAMEGLPCAVQIVGRRLTEEKTLGCMQVVEDALKANGEIYEQLDVEKVMRHEFGRDEGQSEEGKHSGSGSQKDLVVMMDS